MISWRNARRRNGLADPTNVATDNLCHTIVTLPKKAIYCGDGALLNWVQIVNSKNAMPMV